MGDGGNMLYAKGCNIDDADSSDFAAAIAVAKEADLLVVTVGEARNMSGEAKSRSKIDLPGVQIKLLRLLAATGKPIVLLVHAGRPLIIQEAADLSSAVLYTWWLGTEAGNAIADVLFGDYNPSGKLPMTFPRNEGQIPIYYNHFNTGRPPQHENDANYVSAYIDLPNSPAYPFGFGLSYTQFDYGNMRLSDTLIRSNQQLQVELTITNTGQYAGRETVQLYMRDLFASVVRPVKSLIGFRQVFLEPGESQVIKFEIDTNDLRFYNHQLEYVWEPGAFDIMIGSNALQCETRRVFFVN